MAILIGAIVLFTVSNTMNAAVVERTVEIGTLRAIGLRRAGIRTLFVSEGLLLGALGAIAGVAVALILAALINHSGLTWTPPGRVNPIGLHVRVWGETQLLIGTAIALIGRGAVGLVAGTPSGAARGRGGIASCLMYRVQRRYGTVCWRSLLILLPLAAEAPSHPIAQLDAQKILAASDAVRNPSRSFGLTTTMTEYRNGRQTDVSTLQIYAKADPGSGQYRNLIRFVAPARDVNKLMLKNGNDLWFYDPSSQASVRISPRQRLLGQAANGDVVTVNFAKDYHAKLVGDEDIDDGDRVSHHCHKLALTAAASDVTYDSLEIWIDSRQLPSDQGALLRRERSVAQDRLLPALRAPTRGRATHRDGDHRRTGPSVGHDHALLGLCLARRTRQLVAARLPLALQDRNSHAPRAVAAAALVGRSRVPATWNRTTRRRWHYQCPRRRGIDRTDHIGDAGRRRNCGRAI
jgi:outer membrane lipoprotein-sorting protein